MPTHSFLYLMKKKLRKSQMSLFDWQPTHEELRAREAHQRRLKSGNIVQVAATQAKTKVKDPAPIPKGTRVLYKTPDMPRKKKGTIISGDHRTGYTIKPNREGYQLNPPPVYAPREHIWTHVEHNLILAPKRQVVTPQVSVQRKEEGTAKVGMAEADILKHPAFVKPMKQTLSHLAGKNGFNPYFQEQDGVLKTDDPQANELFSEYIVGAMGAFRAASSKAEPADISEFNNHLNGISTQSKIMMSMHRTGKTTAMRHLIANNDRLQEEQSYDSSMEDDMESGMRQVAADAVADIGTRQTGADKIALETGIMQQLKRLDDPVAEAIIKMKFGLGKFDKGHKNQDIAAALNRSKVPHGDDGEWDADKVQQRMTAALASLARTRGMKDLLGFLKSMRELKDLRKARLDHLQDLMDRFHLVKSHVKSYTKQDGTYVQEHDDKRTRHEHIAMHEIEHKENLHPGANLKHGSELIDHLKNKGWKHKEVSAVRRNESLKVGSKHDMPKPAEVKGANKENSALVSAQNVINKMHETAKKHDDPVAYLKHVATSRSNPYLKAADDYRTALLQHFGHDVDHDTKDQRLEKDGHAIVLSGKDGDHTVEHAGYEQKEDKGAGKVNPAKDHLTQAIAKLGGLNAAEAKKQFDLTGKDFPAIKSALRKDGLDPDKLAESLAEHGYIRRDENGKHDYDDFQDKLRQAATGEKVYSQQRDQKDADAELAKQEQEFYDSMAIDDPSEASGYADLHQSAQEAYMDVYQEAFKTFGMKYLLEFEQKHKDDVPFGREEYLAAVLREKINEHKRRLRERENDSGTGKQHATGGIGQAVSQRGGDDAGKAAGGKAEPAAGAKSAASDKGERPRSGADADAVKPKLVGLKKLRADASKMSAMEFIDKYNAEFLPEHHDAGTSPANVIHDYIQTEQLDPSEWETWQDYGSHNSDKIKRFVADLQRGDTFPPVIVEGTRDDKEFKPQVLNGHHRLAAHKEANIKGLPVVYDTGTLSDIWLKENGKPNTRADQRQMQRDYATYLLHRSAVKKSVFEASHLKKAGIKVPCLLRKRQ